MIWADPVSSLATRTGVVGGWLAVCGPYQISGLSPTHTCVKLGARVLYLPRGRAAPGMLVDIIDYNPGKEKWLVQMPGGRTHWMVLSRDKFMVDRCWKIHSARLAEQHRLYKYALSVSDDMFVPCIAPGFRHWVSE